MKRIAFLWIAILLLPLAAKAQTQCPWINKATVAGSADIPVQLVMQSNMAQRSCVFRYMNEGIAYQLRVTVYDTAQDTPRLTPYESQCASGMTRLNGIGNEAFLCRAKPRAPFAEQVVGRVRNQVFVIDASADPSKDARTRETLREKTNLAAEQVAGNLF